MNLKQIGIGLVLADFTAFTAYVVYQYGYAGLLQLALANAATIQVSLDLVIALSLVTLWMWRDARERGVSVVPYLVLTLTLGSIGPLVYLFRRAGDEVRIVSPAAAVRMRA
jgi:hypothetical protein